MIDDEHDRGSALTDNGTHWPSLRPPPANDAQRRVEEKMIAALASWPHQESDDDDNDDDDRHSMIERAAEQHGQRIQRQADAAIARDYGAQLLAAATRIAAGSRPRSWRKIALVYLLAAIGQLAAETIAQRIEAADTDNHHDHHHQEPNQ